MSFINGTITCESISGCICIKFTCNLITQSWVNCHFTHMARKKLSQADHASDSVDLAWFLGCDSVIHSWTSHSRRFQPIGLLPSVFLCSILESDKHTSHLSRYDDTRGHFNNTQFNWPCLEVHRYLLTSKPKHILEVKIKFKKFELYYCCFVYNCYFKRFFTHIISYRHILYCLFVWRCMSNVFVLFSTDSKAKLVVCE